MSNNPGPGVDAHGNPVIDPTKNVMNLVEASVARLDDLRELDARHRIEIDRLVANHLAQIGQLRADYGEKLRIAETQRIDAIRAVDVGAVQRAAEVAAAQAGTLANQVAQSAETLRTQVAAAAQASAVALAAALDPIQKSIDDLRRAQYEAQGQKTQVVEARGANSTTIAILALMGTVIVILIAVAGLLLSKN